MNAEISRLGLPRGVWQKEILKVIPEAVYVVMTYPDERTALVEINSEGEHIAKFSMSFLYGCKGILVSHAMEVFPNWQGKGIAKRLQPIKDQIAKDLRCSLLLATVRADNTAEKSVLTYADWELVDTFTNDRTGHEIEVYTRRIK